MYHFDTDKDFGASFDWHSHVFVKQGPPPLASGQYPPLWAKATLNFRKPKLIEWNIELHPAYRNPAREYQFRFMPSLKDAGLPLYPAYLPEEIAIHYPQLLFSSSDAAAPRAVEVISDEEEDEEGDWEAFRQLAVPKPHRPSIRILH